jgi:hypothetical protein
MNFCARGFNLYLLVPVLLCACVSDRDKDKGFLGTLRIHIESHGSVPEGEGKTVKVLRSEPVEISINPESILNEANMLAVNLMDTPGGGYAIKIKFDETGSWTLEQYSAANPGGHFVIFGQWDKDPSDGRWLAAPMISRHIGDGILTFTPDCSRDEAQKLVTSVSRTIKKIQTGTIKSK